MEENRNENSGEVAAAGSGLRSKLENFWYYYKWHTIAAAFLIIAILVCSLQMCSKVAVDFQLMYAGGTSISRQSVGGDVPAYNQLCSLIADYVDDVDGDGHKNIAFATYYLPSPDEIKAIEADGGEVSYSLMEKDEEAMESRFGIGDYYLCFLSPFVYEQYKGEEGACIFSRAALYAPEDSSLEYYSEYAVKLSSTAFYKDNAIVRDSLPENTLVVLRIKSAAGATFNKKENDASFARAEAAFRAILAE